MIFFFILVMRTFEIYSLNKFQIYNTVLLTMISTLHYIPRYNDILLLLISLVLSSVLYQWLPLILGTLGWYSFYFIDFCIL